MTSIILILTYLGCLSSGAMLSMLLLLIGAYVGASMWLIAHGVIYTGLLYILVYVGAIVVLIMFVVQLTNTSLSGDVYQGSGISSTLLILVQNTVLLLCLSILLTSAYSILSSDLLLSVSQLNLTDALIMPSSTSITNTSTSIDGPANANNLSTLASSIFNEYGYILILSAHAILLAVVGPIKLALSDSSVSE